MEPSDEAIKIYAERHNFDLEEAKKRLEENYRNEVENVDAKEIALKISNGFKIISPKVLGLEQREQDHVARIKGLEARVNYLQSDKAEITAINARLGILVDSSIDVARQLEELTEEAKFQPTFIQRLKWLFFGEY